eukprot:365764-Chlamydomonas_euryale.AAC.5
MVNPPMAPSARHTLASSHFRTARAYASRACCGVILRPSLQSAPSVPSSRLHKPLTRQHSSIAAALRLSPGSLSALEASAPRTCTSSTRAYARSTAPLPPAPSAPLAEEQLQPRSRSSTLPSLPSNVAERGAAPRRGAAKPPALSDELTVQVRWRFWPR